MSNEYSHKMAQMSLMDRTRNREWTGFDRVPLDTEITSEMSLPSLYQSLVLTSLPKTGTDQSTKHW